MDDMLIAEWRELGFYYDFDERLAVNQWRFYGSRQGLQQLAKLLLDYANNPAKNQLTEDAHYGPYSYLKLTTLTQPVITRNYLGGALADFARLSQLISHKVSQHALGDVFSIDQEWGVGNTATAKCFIMVDTFDPASLDELIRLDRRAAVNAQWQSRQKN
ncbi:hypothetical protein GCM10027341_22420 [Spirosoma knui]